MQPFPFRPKWKLNPLDLHQRSEERGKLSCYRSCSESSPATTLWQNTKFFWHSSMTWGSAFLPEGLLSKNKANAGQTFALYTVTHWEKVTTNITFCDLLFLLLLRRLDRDYLLDMTHQCLSFSKLSLMMTFKLGKSIDLSLHTGINLSFLSHPNLILIKRSKNIPRHTPRCQ